MIRVLLFGARGRMGQVVSRLAAAEKDLEITAGFDRATGQESNSYPVYSDPGDYRGKADVAIDFSHPSYLGEVLATCVEQSVPLVIAVTGHTPAQLAEIEQAAEKIPLLRSPNLAAGVNAMIAGLRAIEAGLSRDYDVEIIEKHHRNKADSPSGTAIMLAGAINGAMGAHKKYVCAPNGRRHEYEIGIHSIRCGALPGEHTVVFAGAGEIIEVKHTALNRDIFALGALQAARFLLGAQAGLYSMADIFSRNA